MSVRSSAPVKRPPIAWILPSIATSAMWSRPFGMRREHGPGVGRGIVDLVGRDGLVEGQPPAHGVDLAVEHGDADRAAALAQRGERAPDVEGRIIFEHRRLAVLVHRGDEAADRDDLAVHHRDAHVVERARHRIADAPMIGRDLVFLVVRYRGAGDAAAEDVDLAADLGERNLRARRDHRRLLGPVALADGRRALAADHGRHRAGDDDERTRGSELGCLHGCPPSGFGAV